MPRRNSSKRFVISRARTTSASPKTASIASSVASEAMRALVEHHRALEGVERAEPGESPAGLRRQEALEDEPVGGHAGRRQRSHQGRGARDRHHRDVRLAAEPHQPEARVRHAGRAGVRHERDPRARLEPPQQLGPAAGLVVLEVRDERRAHPVRLEQAPGPAGVLGGDEVGLSKDAEGAQRDVLEVADRRGDDEEGARRQRRRRRAARRSSPAAGPGPAGTASAGPGPIRRSPLSAR